MQKSERFINTDHVDLNLYDSLRVTQSSIGQCAVKLLYWSLTIEYRTYQRILVES